MCTDLPRVVIFQVKGGGGIIIVGKLVSTFITIDISLFCDCRLLLMLSVAFC